MIKFKHADHPAEYTILLNLIDRLEYLAYQAERGWWDMARAQWNAQRYIGTKPLAVANTLCAGAEEVCNDILERLAYICDATFTALDWSTSGKTLYVGGKHLELWTDPVTTQQQQQQQVLQGVTQVKVIANSLQQPSEAEENAAKNNRIVTGVSVIEGLRNQIRWMQNWYWNAYSSGMWDAYSAAYSDTYTYVSGLIDNIGPNFALPMTGFYSSQVNNFSTYDRPRLEVSFSDANEMAIGVRLKYNDATTMVPGGPENGSPLLQTDEWLHIVRLGIPAYSHYEDKVYLVLSTDANYAYLAAPADEQLPVVESDPIEEFGEGFLIRRIREAE